MISPVEEGTDDPPPSVAHTAQFLADREVWFVLGRNHEARSCRDAANKRTRLGETGIPLWDELKSFFGSAQYPDGRRQYLIVHCRGDRLLDLDRTADVIGARIQRLGKEELANLGMEYGLVNPFKARTDGHQQVVAPTEDDILRFEEKGGADGQLMSSGVLQVFDEDLVQPIGLPGTVMTNAGDLTWSVEFHANKLVDALDHAMVAEVSVSDPEEPPRPQWATHPPTIGILTGNGPESGMMLWRMINDSVRDGLGRNASGDTSMPRVVVQSLPELGLTMELDQRHRDVWPALRTATGSLCRDGARLVTLACNTTPHFSKEIRTITAEYGAEFVSIAEVAGDWLRANGITEIALVGVTTVADLGPWSPYREPLAGISVEIPDDRTMQRINELAYDVKARGADHRSLNELRNILNLGVEAKVVLLALTEISLVLEQQKKAQRSDRLLVDTMSLYASEIARRFLGDSSTAPSLTVIDSPDSAIP